MSTPIALRRRGGHPRQGSRAAPQPVRDSWASVSRFGCAFIHLPAPSPARTPQPNPGAHNPPATPEDAGMPRIAGRPTRFARWTNGNRRWGFSCASVAAGPVRCTVATERQASTGRRQTGVASARQPARLPPPTPTRWLRAARRYRGNSSSNATTLRSPSTRSSPAAEGEPRRSSASRITSYALSCRAFSPHRVRARMSPC